MMTCHFWAQNGLFAPNKIFFWNITSIILIYWLATFIVQNFKKILFANPELWGCTIFGPKMAHFPWDFFFFIKHVNEPWFFHSCLSTCQNQSEILAIKEYKNLIGWGPFLAITWEPDFSQACSFCIMLMNHKNFHFTQIPDKTNDVIFLKSPNTMFRAIFDQKSDSVTHNFIWAPSTMLSFRKN